MRLHWQSSFKKKAPITKRTVGNKRRTAVPGIVSSVWNFTRHFFKEAGLQKCSCQGEGHAHRNSSTARWQNGEDGEDEGSNKTNLAHYIVAPPHYKHKITIGGTVIILFEEEEEQRMKGV